MKGIQTASLAFGLISVRSHPNARYMNSFNQQISQSFSSPTRLLFPRQSLLSFIIRQLRHNIDAQNHDQQPNRHDNKQREPEPT